LAVRVATRIGPAVEDNQGIRSRVSPARQKSKFAGLIDREHEIELARDYDGPAQIRQAKWNSSGFTHYTPPMWFDGRSTQVNWKLTNL
jgi:hypothetical protein